jgi:hypothetical protein
VEQITTGEGTKIQAGNKNLGRRKIYDYMGNTKLVCGTIHNYKEGTKFSLWNNSRIQRRDKNSSTKQTMTTK